MPLIRSTSADGVHRLVRWGNHQGIDSYHCHHNFSSGDGLAFPRASVSTEAYEAFEEGHSQRVLLGSIQAAPGDQRDVALQQILLLYTICADIRVPMGHAMLTFGGL